MVCESDESAGKNQRHDGHDLDQDIHGRTRSIFEGVAHGVADNGSLLYSSHQKDRAVVTWRVGLN